MITIGSYACKHIWDSRQDSTETDVDFMCTEHEYNIAKTILLSQGAEIIHEKEYTRAIKGVDYIFEFMIGKNGNSTEQLLQYCNNKEDGKLFGEVAPINVLYLLKMSHRFLRNSPHFLKTMKDIKKLRQLGATIPEELESVLALREKETYTYRHPVLDVSKNQFFDGDGVDYQYDHDTIHEAIAIGEIPAYRHYMKDGSEVMTSKEKFFSVPETIRLLGVYEETCVLALERSQIPFGDSENAPTCKHSFITALIKVCTSITSGWFREYAYENFYEVINIYRNFGEEDYLNRFNANKEILKPFKSEMVL